MSVINTNVKALQANNAMVANNRLMTTTMQQLSTGKRINSAGDDAAGLAVVSKMTAQIRGLDQAVRNANDSIALLQTAEGAMIEQTNMMQRMRELAVQSANDTNTTDDRKYLDLEFQQLKEEINRIGNNTQWNGMNILDKSFAEGSGNFVFQVGANADQTIERVLGDFRTQGSIAGTAVVATTTGAATSAAQESSITIGGTFKAGDVISVNVGEKSIQYTVQKSDIDPTAVEDVAETRKNVATSLVTALGTISGIKVVRTDAVIAFSAVTVNAAGANTTTARANEPFQISTGVGGLMGNINASKIETREASNSAVSALDLSLKVVNEARAEIGSTINRLNFAADNLTNVSMNTNAARSRILDTDYAQTTTELARSQIIQQAATAMLAQANQQPAAVLSLLQ
jgi:flagellin